MDRLPLDPASGHRTPHQRTVQRLATHRDLQRMAASGRGTGWFLAGLPSPDAAYVPQEPVNRALAALIAADPALEQAFGEAIAGVAEAGVPELSAIQSLPQFYFYLDRLVRWIPEIRVWQVDGQTVHERTVYLRICQLYFYCNQPSLEAVQSPIAPVAGQVLTPVSAWLRDFALAWGSFLDTPASAAELESFCLAPEYTWQDYEYPPTGYATFNEFFARCFSDLDRLRPLAGPDDSQTVVFPAESTFVGQWTVSTRVGPPLPAAPSITVKHIQWSIDELLADSAHADAFAGGAFTHSFLNTYDYHRLHTPVAGKVLEAKFIPGQGYLQVDLQTVDGDALPNGDLPRAIIPSRYLDAEDPTGYQFVQCRGLIVLETESFGKVAVLPMGMAQVSSVVFTDPAAGHAPIRLSPEEARGLDYDQQVERLNARIAERLVGQHLGKGEMFSFFQFGGSDCVMVFERGAGLAVTAEPGVHYPIRSQFGVATRG